MTTLTSPIVIPASFSSEERPYLISCVSDYRAWVKTNIRDPLWKSLLGLIPNGISEQLRVLDETELRLARNISTNADLPVIRRALAHQRRTLAEKHEELLIKINNNEIRAQLQVPVDRVERMMSAPWFPGPALEAMRLTDFLTIKAAYSLLQSELNPPAPEYDEKFGLLLAPGQFLPRLAIARREALLRNTTTGVAFIDIDKFKDFNTRYNEYVVDQSVLPKFMSALEAHVHSHGHAFRFGGDEYMVLLPNTCQRLAVDFLRRFQVKVTGLQFVQASDRMTISIGLTTASPGSLLTDRELQQRATEMKQKAKEFGRDRIVWADGDPLTQGKPTVFERT